MTNGVLSLEPLKFGVAGGTLASNIRLDGSTTPLKGRVDTEARHLKLKQLFPNVKTMQSALGEINGDAALSATGNSPAELAATLNGEVKALITDGTVSRLYMEAAGLNVANVVYEKMFGNRDVRINCAAADFVVTNGVLDSKVFALDTDDAVINMDGHIVGVNATALALRGGAMIGLGLINPFAALIPLIAPSNNQPLPCNDLLAQMQTRPAAPPAGQKMSASKGANAAAADINGGNAPAAIKPWPARPTLPQGAFYKGS